MKLKIGNKCEGLGCDNNKYLGRRFCKNCGERIEETEKRFKIILVLLMMNEKELKDDMKKMIILISAFTKPNTEGSDLLDEWKKKYFGDEK